jgi:pimeloyl-ACP methyl ester carboxylesterase
MELIVNGNSTFAATGGKDFDPALPTVIFLHGASFDRTVWNLQTRYFAYHGFGVLAVDLPGHGRSAGSPLNAIDDFVSWLFTTMDAAGVQKAHIVGHSLGALIALGAAAKDPERLSGISLVGMAYPMPVGDPLLVPAEANDDVVTERLVSWSFGQAAAQGGNTVPGLWMTGIGTRVVERTDDGVLFADLTACNKYDGGDDAAAAVRCPVQFVLGSKDMMTPLRSAKAFAAKFDNPAVEVIPDAGHNLMIEYPDETLDALKQFIG